MTESNIVIYGQRRIVLQLLKLEQRALCEFSLIMTAEIGESKTVAYVPL